MRRGAWLMPAALALLPAAHCQAQPDAADPCVYCNAVQGRVGFIRYPLGTIGVWSTAAGEIADVMTRVPRIYPCLGAPVVKGMKDDWRASITGDPALLTVKYAGDRPCGATTVRLTVSPHVSVFQVVFPRGTDKRYVVIDFGKAPVDAWAALNRWTDRRVALLDNRTLQAAVGEPGGRHAYYVVRFTAPCTGCGTIGVDGGLNATHQQAVGPHAALYARFEARTVTVAVAESFLNPQQAEGFLAHEFTTFAGVERRCRAAWDRVLGRLEADGPESAKRMAYTALYTIYANIIDGGRGSCYAKYYPRPRSVASSDYWQFIGGYQSCCWDNIRATYPFLILAYPEVMTDVLNTYLARYRRDGCLDGDAGLFTGPLGHHNIRFTPTLVADALEAGIRAPYGRLYAALRDNYGNPAYFPASLASEGHLVQSAAGGFACSRTLEYAEGLRSLALLAQANGDRAAARRDFALSHCYTNLWDSTHRVFRVKNRDGTWGPIENKKWTWNPNAPGLFEGTSRDWSFWVPFDPYGLIHLPAQADLTPRVVDYCLHHAWFNDYQEIYPYLLYYTGAPNEAQYILRRVWVPMFRDAVMYEGVRPNVAHSGWHDHYTGSSGWLLCSILDLYPIPAPPGQFIIGSPSLTEVVIHHGRAALTIRTVNGGGDNIYIQSIKVNGRAYPCYFIPASRLRSDVKIVLQMGSDPAHRLGRLYLAYSDGWVLNAALASPSSLRCTVRSPVGEAHTAVYSETKPTAVLVNGKRRQGWRFDLATHLVVVDTRGTATIDVIAK